MNDDLHAIARERDWEVRPLGSILTAAQYGLSVRGDSMGDLPMLRMNCQQRGRVVFRDLQYVSRSVRNIDAYLLRPGDLLFNRTNSLEHVGRTALFDQSREAVFASYLIRLTVDRAVVDPAYLNYFLNWPRTQRTLKGYASRGVSQANISASKLKDLEVVLPPIETQRAIVRLLDAVDTALAAEESRLAYLKELWDVTLRRFFTHSMGGSATVHLDVDTVPETWGQRPLGALGTLVSGGTPPKGVTEYWEGSVPWMSPKDMKARRLTESADHITDAAASEFSRLVPAGSILIVIRGMILAREIPICAVDRAVAFNQDVKAIIIGPDIDPDFLLYALLARREVLERQIGTSAHGTRRLGTSTLETLQIPVAPRDKQKQIGVTMRSIDDRIEISRRKAILLGELLEMLRGEVMTGTTSTDALLTASQSSS